MTEQAEKNEEVRVTFQPPVRRESQDLVHGSYSWVCVGSEHISLMTHRSRVPSWGECLGRPSKKDEQKRLQEADTMTYDVNELSRWSAFCMFRGSAWDNPSLWSMFLKTFVVAAIVALFVLLGTPANSRIRSDKFAKLATFLNVFVGLLLSFFMSSSMTRWYSCVNAFLELFDAVRNLQMQCHALGVVREREEMLVRYGVLSSWLLHLQLLAQNRPDNEQHEANEQIWVQLMEEHPGLCTQEEKDMLKLSQDPSHILWTWVSSLVGRMANDGDIPPMASPTYGRILAIVEAAHGGIRAVRAAVCVQAPFIYVHTLAVLVHFNNLINAISFGMTTGVVMGKLGFDDGDGTITGRSRIIAKEAQNMTIAFFISMLGPFIYQALLEVAVCIARPFMSEDAMIPTVRLLKSLERDLCECDHLARMTPHWDPPAFKQPAVAAPAAPTAATPAKK